MVPLKNLDRISVTIHSELYEFVSLARKKFGRNIVAVILFGSAARGNQKRRSDIDFCLVVKKKKEQDRLELMRLYSKPCDIILREEKDFKQYLKNLSALDMTIFEEGIVIWGTDVLQRQQGIFKDIKKRYQLVSKPFLGKGVWEIGLAG